MALKDREMFSERIKELRNELGYSAKEFSKHLNVGLQLYYKYEHGSAVPSFNVLMRIADKCNVSLDWLCGRNVSCKHTANQNEISSVLKQLLAANEMGKQIEIQISCDGISMVNEN